MPGVMDGPEVKWPSYEPRVYEPGEIASLGVPARMLETLTTHGIPSSIFGRLFEATNVLSLISSSTGVLVRCGTSGVGSDVCIDPRNGEVILVAGPGRWTQRVNATLEQFRRTARAVIERFPFHSTDASDEEVEAAARSIGEVIRSVDPSCMEEGMFWPTLVDDIGMRDFDLEVMGLSPDGSASLE